MNADAPGADGALVVVTVETTEALMAILEEVLPVQGLFPACWIDDEKDHGHVQFFADTLDEAGQIQAQVESVLAEFAGETPWTLRMGDCPREDWAESWKAYFKAERVSEHVVIMPSWDPVEGEAGDCLIRIDPGMSFGTGQHGTTRACIQLLDGLTDTHADASLLDVGCGSGILSIAGVMLGYTRVTAIDLDPLCVSISSENACINGVNEKIECYEGDLADLHVEPYAVVVANVLAPVLIEHHERLLSALAEGTQSRLILSGILTREFDELTRHFESVGVRLLRQVTLAEWTSGLFSR